MLDLVHGWTADIQYCLKDEGEPTNLTGLTVTLMAYDLNGDQITMTGVLTNSDPTNGIVTFAPGAGDIDSAKSPISVRFKVSDGAKHAFYPSRDFEHWFVHEK